jgi:Fe-S-cluster containining protein
MIVRLSRAYRSRQGAPAIERIDTNIFEKTYFAECLACTFCHDSCCAPGADIDTENVARLKEQPGLAQMVDVDPGEWFRPGFVEDPEFPGGRYTRTAVKDGSCVFLNRKGRGCLIHAYALGHGLDHRQLKPLVCTLFPLTFDDSLLQPSKEVKDASLVCVGPGPTLYRAVRDDLAYYFGTDFVAELDRHEATFLARRKEGGAMRLTFFASFDIGLSVGIDDSAFASDADVARFSQLIQAPVVAARDLRQDFGLDLPIGRGLRVDLIHHRMLVDWTGRANEINEKGHPKLSHWDERDGPEGRRMAKELMTRCQFRACHLDLYSLGIAFLRLDLDNLPSDHSNGLVRFLQAFEYAAYELAAPHLKALAGHFLTVFRNHTEFEDASKRFDVLQTEAPDLIPGFTFVVTLGRNEAEAQTKTAIAAMQAYEGQYIFRRLELDEAVVHLGWAACVIEPRRDDYERAYRLLQVGLVYGDLCSAFERLFTRHMRETVRSRLVDSIAARDPAFLNDLRTLAMTITQLTSFSATTANISDLYLFAAFDEMQKVSERHARIRTTSEVFYNLHSDLARLAAEQRGRWLNRFVFLLTTLTVMSVAADVFNVIENDKEFKPLFSLRSAVLAAIFLFSLGVAAGVKLVGPRLDGWMRAAARFFHPKK